MDLVVVYDLDDTLSSQRDFAISGFKAVEDALGIEGFSEQARALYDEGLRGRIFNEILKDEDKVGHCVEIYRNHTPTLELYKDAMEQVLAAKGCCQQGLITDGLSRVQRQKIEALKLSKYIDQIVVTDELGASKPSPIGYEKVMDALGRDKNFVYIGDNPLKDFEAPRALGWKTVRMRRGGGDHFKEEGGVAADIEIQSFYELPVEFGGCVYREVKTC